MRFYIYLRNTESVFSLTSKIMLTHRSATPLKNGALFESSEVSISQKFEQCSQRNGLGARKSGRVSSDGGGGEGVAAWAARVVGLRINKQGVRFSLVPGYLRNKAGILRGFF